MNQRFRSVLPGQASLLSLALSARSNQPTEQATASRHRGREFKLTAPVLGSRERT